MVKITWTELAIYDLKLIHEYVSNDSMRYADRLIEKLIERVAQLENFPKSGRIVPEFNLTTLRELIEGNYRIIYKISPREVVIVRVHHAARHLQ